MQDVLQTPQVTVLLWTVRFLIQPQLLTRP